MRVDPFKPTLKAPGIKLFKLKYDKPLSNFAFKFKLRRYNQDAAEDAGISKDGELAVMSGGEDGFVRKVTGAGKVTMTLKGHAKAVRAVAASAAGAYTRPLLSST